MPSDRLIQIARCMEEIHRSETELAGDKDGTGSWLGYMDWLEELHYQVKERTMTDDSRKLGIGGAPTRATILPTDSQERKKYPIASGVLDYFPDALAAISHISYLGNEQHNPGQPLHWARGKSADEADTLMRHFLQRGTLDIDGVPHSAKMAWRALALLQKELEER